MDDEALWRRSHEFPARRVMPALSRALDPQLAAGAKT